MRLVGIDLERLLRITKETPQGYLLNIGKQVEITTTIKQNKNKFMVNTLYSSKKEDKYMVRYKPYNKVIFDSDFIEECIAENKIISGAFSVNQDCSTLFIGKREKYEIKTGVLLMSCWVSLNNMVESQNRILAYSKNRENLVLDKIKLLVIGNLGGDTIDNDGVTGLFYIPKQKGIAYNSGGMSEHLGVSVVNYDIIDCSGWQSYDIKDWLRGCRIV